VLQEANNMTLDMLIDLAYDPYLPAFASLLPGLVAAFDEREKSGSRYSKLAPAIDRLRDWDYRVSVDSVAMTLAHFYGSHYIKTGDNPDALGHINLINYFGSASPAAERLRVFAESVAALESDFGRWDVPWGEVNRFQRLHGEIRVSFDDSAPSLPVSMASGRWGALASFGARAYEGTKRIYGNSGNSFVAVVEFGDKVRAKSLLAGGQSGDMTSQHFLDQGQRYVDRAFKAVAFYPDDVQRVTVRTYHPGS
jgi:acyl-homoserine lactone acylase PvdQ